MYAGDVPDDFICDTAGDLDPETGTYTAFLDVTDPALTFSPMVVGRVLRRWVEPRLRRHRLGGHLRDDPSILAVFPNNAPGDQYDIVTTTT